MNYRDLINQTNSLKDLKREIKAVRFSLILLWILVFIVMAAMICHADEPWYYQTDADYRFMVPDKVQHFYGCYAITVLDSWKAAAALAVLKEVYDAHARHAFSLTDLTADALGIAAALLNHKVEIPAKSPRKFAAALDWHQARQEIVFVLKFNL